MKPFKITSSTARRILAIEFGLITALCVLFKQNGTALFFGLLAMSIFFWPKFMFQIFRFCCGVLTVIAPTGILTPFFYSDLLRSKNTFFSEYAIPVMIFYFLVVVAFFLSNFQLAKFAASSSVSRVIETSL